MRIDLPLCDFIYCRNRFDGNCKAGNEYNRCQYRRLKEQEPCEDCISRKQAIKTIEKFCPSKCVQVCVLTELPPVSPQPKTGYWISSPNDCFAHCSECGLHGDKGIYKHYKYCPNCGAKMEIQ